MSSNQHIASTLLTTDANRPGLSWHEVATLRFSALSENQLIEARAGEKVIGLLRKGGQLLAFAAKCPHAGAPLCTGWLDAQGRIVCPDHKYRFDPANGRNTSGEGYKLFTYPTQVKEDVIYIGLIQTNY
ncbi:MAG: Rieske (2Fe-2S) protein [Taibaiella sp.]|nr:Rieske (2Fe-2S) protein [Taibaiella sp.]